MLLSHTPSLPSSRKRASVAGPCLLQGQQAMAVVAPFSKEQARPSTQGGFVTGRPLCEDSDQLWYIAARLFVEGRAPDWSYD